MPVMKTIFRLGADGIEEATMYDIDAAEALQKHGNEWFASRAEAEAAQPVALPKRGKSKPTAAGVEAEPDDGATA